MIYIFSLILGLMSSHAAPRGQALIEEYGRLKTKVLKLKPEFEVGGLLKGKDYGDYKLLWRFAEQKGEHEVIRLLRSKADGHQDFEIAFHVSSEIVPGRLVIRRFVGPASSGWRADTVDAFSGEDLGTQGTETPFLDSRDVQILKDWELDSQ
jgi:hypothetical protein